MKGLCLWTTLNREASALAVHQGWARAGLSLATLGDASWRKDWDMFPEGGSLPRRPEARSVQSQAVLPNSSSADTQERKLIQARVSQQEHVFPVERNVRSLPTCPPVLK